MLAEYATKVDREKLEQLSKAFHRSKASVPTRSVQGATFCVLLVAFLGRAQLAALLLCTGSLADCIWCPACVGDGGWSFLDFGPDCCCAASCLLCCL